MGLTSCDAAVLPGVAFFDSLVKASTCSGVPICLSPCLVKTNSLLACSYLVQTPIFVASDADARKLAIILEGVGPRVLAAIRYKVYLESC